MTCECVNCEDCQGSGHIWLSDDPHYCEMCGGSGVAEQCQECIQDLDDERRLEL